MGRLLKKCIISIALFAFSFTAYGQNAVPETSDALAKGQSKSTTCVACHGAKGVSSMPQWPNLAGQGEKYLYQQMLAFKKGKEGGRYDPAMTPMMATLSEQDMKDIASFYAKQTKGTGATDKKLLAQGQMLYRGGDAERSITACIACHGPRGLGNQEAGFPLLSGQHTVYVIKQLSDYQNGVRTTDINNIMRDVSTHLNPADMKALASYVAGLH